MDIITYAIAAKYTDKLGQRLDGDISSLSTVVQEIAESISEEYNPELTYAQGALVRHDGKLYRSNVVITVPEPWTPEHWDEVDLEDEITAIKQELASHKADNAIHVTSAEKENWNAKYDKPADGIPKTDLSSNVQASLEKADSALQEHQSLAAYRTSSDQDVIDEAIKDDVSNIESLIPSQASHDNQLADKDFVNSSIGTNTARYISDNGLPFASVAALEAYTGTVTNNDYAFVTGTDESGNVYYDRYKATVSGSAISWAKEYRLNNSSFTAAQWASISSGITALLVSNLQSHLQNDDIHVTAQDKTNWNNKYSKPSDGIPDSDLKEAHYTKSEADSLLDQKVSIQQDAADAGKVLGIDDDGRIVPVVENDADAVHYVGADGKTDAQKAQARENINAAAPDGFYGDSGGVYQYSTNFLGKNAPTAVKDLVFRPTASAMSGTAWSADSIGGDTATIERIKGKTLVFNQLNNNGTSSKTENGVTFTKNGDGSWTINGTAIANATIIFSTYEELIPANHKVFVGFGIRNAITGIKLGRYGFSFPKNVDFIHSYSSDFSAIPQLSVESGTTVNNLKVYPMAIDLTQMYGAGKEPQAVEEFKAQFPLDYYAYNPGELISFNGTGLQTTGFNQWDEEWEVGSIGENGNPISSSSYIRSKNFNVCLPNTDYYAKCKSTIDNFYIFWYDGDYNYISNSWAPNKVKTSPANAHYFKIRSAETTYNHDICINLSWSGIRNGDYEPYWQRTLALPIAQYFPDGMKSAGTVYDELTKDKAIKRVGKVDLSTLSWAYSSTQQNWQCHDLSPVIRASSTLKSTNYPNADVRQTSNIGIYCSSIGVLWCGNGSTTEQPTGMLCYVLAEPVETPISPELNLTYKVDDFGTEKLLPENTSEPVTTPMDADIVYQIDYEAQVRNMDALVGGQINTALGNYYNKSQVDNALAEKQSLIEDDQSLVDNFSYEGVDLGVKFADEIAAAPYNGDPAAWIKGRIRAKNYKGLHLRDYFTITCANGTIIKPQIMGINTYKGSAATEIGDHIDFISKDCWPGAVQYNPVNYNNGIGLDKFTGDGSTTVFQLCHRSATTFPALSKVTIGGADAATDSYTYDATTGVLTFNEAPASGAVIKAVWATPITLPFLASKVRAFLMSEKAGVPNEAAADPALIEVDYTNGGVWKNIPDNWKAVIADKLSYPGIRYAIGTLRTSENDWTSKNLGKLWLPDECEVYGCQKFGHIYTAAYGRMYPGFLDGNRRKGDGNGAARTHWWLLPANSGDSTGFCYVHYHGTANSHYASYTYVRVPVCFRITG